MTAFRTGLGATLLATLIISYNYIELESKLNILSRSRNLIILFGVGGSMLFLITLLAAGFLIATWTSWKDKLIGFLDRGYSLLKRLGKVNLIFFTLGIGLFSLLLASHYDRYLQGLTIRLSIGWLLGLGGAITLKASRIVKSWGQSILIAFLLIGAGYRLAIFTLDVSTYPFSLGWSEASRYYYASLFFSEKLYGMSIPPSVLHPSRYLMQAVPFLLPNSPLWLHRSWQVFLWLASTLTTAGLLVKRITIKDRHDQLTLFLWTSLFLLMTPVYYHLQTIIIIVLWGYNKQKPWRTLLTVVVASIWAGISRINWIPAPGMLAAVLYFLEEPKGGLAFPKYLSKPTLWVLVGSGVGFLSQELYAKLSGNPAGVFGSSLYSQLLWYRLLPNATYPLGILPGALLVIIPGLIIIALELTGRWKRFNILRILGISTILFVLLAGGLIVSVKIGGGSNLHNLDAFLCLFLVVLAYIYFGKLIEGPSKSNSSRHTKDQGALYQITLTAALIAPVIITLNISATRDLPSQEEITQALDTIQTEVDTATINGGKVLFISERQLLMFNNIMEVELVPEYEKVFLMEMAMANNTAYLSEFYKKLEANEFALIISEPLFLNYKNHSQSFGEENNAWVERVAQPILRCYKPKLNLREVRTELLVPRQSTTDCP